MTFLVDAAKYYKSEPHQIAAWEDLEDKLPKYLLEEFQAAYRARQASPVIPVVTNSWEGIYTAAAMAGSKFPAVTAAQWALESAWGQHVSGKNNFFGIKGPGTVKTTWEDYGAGAVTIKNKLILVFKLSSVVYSIAVLLNTEPPCCPRKNTLALNFPKRKVFKKP